MSYEIRQDNKNVSHAFENGESLCGFKGKTKLIYNGVSIKLITCALCAKIFIKQIKDIILSAM
jgi:hypothetical protein